MKLPKSFLSNSDKSKGLSFGILNWVSIILLLAGIIIVLQFGASDSAKATIFIWMLACLLSGTALGFLFGIPKILQNSQATDANATAPTYQQQVNTNLTEISDWLTKIIVGLGLVSLTKIPPYVSGIARILANGLTESGKPPSNMAFAFAYGTIIGYTILGFLIGYIATRLYLAGAFSKADQAALEVVIRKADEAAGAAQSALQKVDFALIKPSATTNDQRQNPTADLDELARKYVQVRSTMQSGSQRTSKMNEIFKEMISIANMSERPDLSVLLKENDIGKRLIGYAYLYSKPDYEYLEQIVDAISTDPTPFGQYWAIQVLEKILALQPGAAIDQNVLKKIKSYYDRLPKGIDREYELGKIMPSLKS